MESENETERALTPEERLANIDKERAGLRAQVNERKTKRLSEAKNLRKARDETVKFEESQLKRIQTVLYTYNKTPQTEKLKMNVLNEISNILSGPVENESVSEEQAEAEAPATLN